MHFKTSLWDTCATEAVLRAAGGRVTDLFGAPLVHAAPPAGASESARALALTNNLGVVASAPGQGAAHDALCATMRGNGAYIHIYIFIYLYIYIYIYIYMYVGGWVGGWTGGCIHIYRERARGGRGGFTLTLRFLT